LEVCVSVLPSLEMTFCPVAWYFPPVFFTSQLVVFASIRLTEILSNGSPVASVEYSPPQQNLWGDSGSGSRPKL
jgi:hypothetical protein